MLYKLPKWSLRSPVFFKRPNTSVCQDLFLEFGVSFFFFFCLPSSDDERVFLFSYAAWDRLKLTGLLNA